MAKVASLNFLSDRSARQMLRVALLFVYFILFQVLILFQKPFLQLDFIIVFYLSFIGLFAHHSLLILQKQSNSVYANSFFSYLADFLILILFMKSFPYLSSFILVLQLFLLFVASFDLELFELVGLGFAASLGVSVINLLTHEAGSMQSLMSLALFNLSYVSVILISRQLKFEFNVLQVDLTQTQKRFRSQEEFSKIVLEKMPLGLAVTQSDHQLILQNSYLQDRLQLESHALSQMFHRQFSFNDDIVLKNKQDESQILNIDKAHYYDDYLNEDLSVYLIRDVTLLRSLEEQKRQNEKMAAVGQLAAGIAHEIRNPLAGISGSIQLLSQDTQDETQKKLMNIIMKEIDRLNNLITEFLDYAKPEKIPDQVINLRNTLEEVVLICKQHKDLPAGIQWKISAQDAPVLGFHEKLKQAFLNIIINGIQAMKNKESAVYKIELLQEGDQAVLRFTDTGCGMSEETRKKMFEPFHTTKPKGTGLGLAITHKILELHKAHINVSSVVDQGTQFTIKLPLFKGDKK